MNETLVRVGGRNVLRVERRIPHPPEKVWRAVSEPAELSAWFPSPVELDELRAGAEIRFAGNGFDDAGTIREVDPPRLLAFDWQGELLRFELTPAGAGETLLVFTHTFDDRAGAASFAAGWNTCLDTLDERLAGLVPDAADVEMSALHERFVARFGLDEGVAERTAGGWRIRFERQLTQHAPEVWSLLTDDGPTPAAGDIPPAAVVPGGAPGAAHLTAVEAPRMLAYERGDGVVRWELAQGTGQGARLIVTETASDGAAEPAEALAAWRDHIAGVAAEVQRRAAAAPR